MPHRARQFICIGDYSAGVRKGNKNSAMTTIQLAIRVDSHIFSSTMPLACDAPAKGFFHSFPK